jgi:enoyl-CoA hydratase
MSALARYELAGGIATITMDDGKVNALSSAMIGEVSAHFDQAERDEAVVVLTGRELTLSAGFDLRTPPEGWPEMLAAGAGLAERMLSFPRPVVVGCNGNAIAMGGFLLLAADYRVGAGGDFRIGLNEVAIGLTLPWFGIAIAKHRLTRPYYDRCTVTGVILEPDEAQAAGFLDEIVGPDEVPAAARLAATRLAGVNMHAHAATKLRIRADVLAGVRDGIERITSGRPPEEI